MRRANEALLDGSDGVVLATPLWRATGFDIINAIAATGLVTKAVAVRKVVVDCMRF